LRMNRRLQMQLPLSHCLKNDVNELVLLQRSNRFGRRRLPE
jgi:hypothetical protein